ncbi:MAG: beta-N-acetylhexosaminidase [Peptostreptococcales bacterium]|jgi:beta-N-acetylhexosaminidase
MAKKFVFGSVLIMSIFLALSGCSMDIHDGEKHKNNVSQQDIEQEIDPIKEQIKNMPLDKKIGQMIIVGLDGTTLDENAKELINNYYVGGFILFKDNLESMEQILMLLNDLKSLNAKNNIPLFLSIDEEGGRVSRMPDEFVKLPSNRVIGQKKDKALCYKIGSVIAEEIKSFGFNMNFAPVLDIDSNPDNPVIGDRSFGTDEKIVSELGIETMKGLQSKGVISVVKHFPGHGDTAVDSHMGLPILDKDLNSLYQLELVPFIKAIENHTDGVMVAHILFNKIDSENPATLSESIMTDLLRKELNYDGLVITDDMTMAAIMDNYELDDAVVKSIKAGSDIILVCHGYENEFKALEAIRNAVKDDIISEERIDESLYRILKTKDQYELKDKSIEHVDSDKINEEIGNLWTTIK